MMLSPRLVLLGAILACGQKQSTGPVRSTTDSSSADSAFALVQSRGRSAMGVDQYASEHSFESLPDGGRITLSRMVDDASGVQQIRAHMREIADSFRQGDFAVPGFVHDRAVPGTAVMRARRSLITYAPDTAPGGGQLRIQSKDPAAIAAIHEFLAFQRLDHRSGSEHSH